MVLDDKHARLVARLISMTSMGKLHWEMVAEPEGSETTGHMHSGQYRAATGDLVFVIFEDERLVNNDFPWMTPNELANPVRSSGVGFSRWDDQVVLRIYDKDEGSKYVETITSGRRLPILRDLYLAAKRCVTGIDAKIDRFLAQSVTHAQ